MNEFLEWLRHQQIALIALVGLIAGFLSHSKSERPKSFKQRVAYFITGTTSSIFLCWMAYEIAFYITDKQNISLAIGGFFAWRGADWATAIVDKWIEARIKGLEYETDNNEI